MSDFVPRHLEWTTYIPLIGVLITVTAGFVTLILTLYINARKDRNAEARRLANERKNIIGAILAELRTIERTLTKIKAGLDKSEHTGIMLYIPTFERATIYERYISQLGSLEISTIEAIYGAYQSIQALPKYIVQLAEGKRAGDGSSFLLVSRNVVATNFMESSLNELRVAIKALDGELGKD
jgi:hypothetical protein